MKTGERDWLGFHLGIQGICWGLVGYKGNMYYLNHVLYIIAMCNNTNMFDIYHVE